MTQRLARTQSQQYSLGTPNADATQVSVMTFDENKDTSAKKEVKIQDYTEL